jgi:hypothetical protein
VAKSKYSLLRGFERGDYCVISGGEAKSKYSLLRMLFFLFHILPQVQKPGTW